MSGLALGLLLLYFIEVVGFFVIAGLVILRKKTPLYIGFALFAFFVGLWQSLQFLSQVVSSSHDLAVWFLQASIVVAGPMAAFFLIFTSLYTGRKPHYLLYVGLGLVAGCLTLLSNSVQDVQITYLGIGVPRLDFWYSILIIFGAFCIGFGIIRILIHLKHTTELIEKKRDITLIASMAFVGALVIFSSFYTSDFSTSVIAQHLIPMAVLIAMVSFFYVIYRGLFDIHFFVVRALAYVVTLFMLAVFCITPLVLGISYLFSLPINGRLPLLVIASVLAFYILTYIRRIFDTFTTKWFFRGLYDPQDVIDTLSYLLARSIDIDVIIKRSSKVIADALQPTLVQFILNDNLKDKQKTIVEFAQKLSFSESSTLVVDEEGDYGVLIEQKVSVIVRLRTTHEVIGYLILGHKKSGEGYTNRDVRLLNTVADELAIAIQNALHFQEIQNFNETLKKEVQEATAQLRETNRKLKKLDEIKDEFISMASHQLRTPLTSVKGYLSMVLEGDAGPIVPQQKQLLEEAFTSAQRMVYLIGDFLNVSRLQTGKFVIEWKPTNLSVVVKEEVDQLRETASRHHIKLQFEPPSNFPTLMLDENKMRQVIMNFADNALFYTRPGGTVRVVLLVTAREVRFEVHDNGIGVPEQERHKLFTKFFRAENARRVRPDGTGIGLFMAKKVVAAHGGNIIFESQEGKGSVFGFILPLTLAHRDL